MIQLRETGLTIDCPDIPALRSEFRARHCVMLKSLIDPDLLEKIRVRLTEAVWEETVHKSVGVECVLRNRYVLSLLHFLLNDPHLLRVIEEITDCRPLRLFVGRVYRMAPDLGHYGLWHNDVSDNRLVGLSLNLSGVEFEGGLFQLRERGSHTIVAEIANTGFGDAFVFRVSPQIEHRVSPIGGRQPKTAFAGWFRDGHRDFRSLLRSTG